MINNASSRRECFQADATATINGVGASHYVALPTCTDDIHSTQATQTVFGHGYSPQEIDRAKLTIHRAIAWRFNNPQAWACIVSHALDLAEKQQPIAAQTLIESVRKKAFVDRFGNDTKTNNDYASVFIRWLWSAYPETRPFIELRRCPVGEVMGL